MRLIDADELKKDDEVTQWLSLNAVRTGKMLKMFSELFVKKIDDAPTVQAVPIEKVIKIIEFEEKWLSQTRMSIRDIDIAFNAMKSKIKQIEGSNTK